MKTCADTRDNYVLYQSRENYLFINCGGAKCLSHLTGQVVDKTGYELATRRGWSGTNYPVIKGEPDIKDRSAKSGSTS